MNPFFRLPSMPTLLHPSFVCHHEPSQQYRHQHRPAPDTNFVRTSKMAYPMTSDDEAGDKATSYNLGNDMSKLDSSIDMSEYYLEHLNENLKKITDNADSLGRINKQAVEHVKRVEKRAGKLEKQNEQLKEEVEVLRMQNACNEETYKYMRENYDLKQELEKVKKELEKKGDVVEGMRKRTKRAMEEME